MPEKVWITCNVCGADSFQELAHVESVGDEWCIGKCTNCGLIYVNPVPLFDKEEFPELSLDFQYTQYMHENISPDVIAYEVEQLRKQFEEFSHFADGEFDPLKFLDVGCGSGAGVRAATDLGWEAVGIDLDKALIKLGQEELKVDLRCSDLLESDFPTNHFHFVRLRDVIEHLPNPYDVLVEIKRILVPGGVTLLVTPNEDSLTHGLRRFLGAKRDTVAAVHPPHHLHGFTPVTMKRIIERAGLTPLLIKTTMPVDPAYVTSNNMRSSTNKAFVAAWHVTQAVGQGSVLVGWLKKEG